MAFAKLFESEKYGQILYTKDYDYDEESGFKICTRVDHPDVDIKFKIGFKTEESANNFFNNTTLKKAEFTAEKLYKQLK